MKLENCLKVYIYNKDNKYIDWILIDTEPRTIASLIARANPYNKLEFTDVLDMPVLNTFGSFINQCSDKGLLQDILEYLLPMQQCEIDPYSVKVDYITAEDTDNETLKEMILNYCNYAL